ncbi:MAG: hypothetical protein JXA96_04175 [Sedimentisphaerales bacterium]|nr:hypothetical protein [Sedimentisphaerales bacterium]
MSLQRVFIFMMILALGCRSVSAERSGERVTTEPDRGNPTEAVTNISAVPENISDMEKEQIELNRTMLLTYSDEAMRINAASLLLFNQNPYARQVLIDTLGLTNNSLARIAICNALIQRTDIPDKSDFIEPLLNIFSTKVDDEAKLVADTMLIYPYSEIGPRLDKIVTDQEQPAKTRINVIAALKKVWEKNAIIRLYRLVDDNNKEVATEAGKALNSLGFQIGTNSLERGKIISDIQNKEIVELQKELLIKQDEQITKQKDNVETLRKFTLSVLEDAYTSIGVDDISKGKFLKKYLEDSRTWVKSWGLEKVRGMRMAANTSIPPELEPAIIKLISDPIKEIRLTTIGLIGLMQTMQTVDLAAPLLAQFDIEKDDQVKIELLDILGIVCSATHKPDSKTKITLDTKQRILGYASVFLLQDDNTKAKVGAKVMRKLLEKDGLQEQEVQKYLTQISDRYIKKNEDPNSTLKSELLDTMVGLSADKSMIRQYARETFRTYFEGALVDNSDRIRSTAIDGLGYVNKASALEILRNRVGEEQSEEVRSKIIDLAKDAGGSDDLNWLAELILGTNAESKQAWIAMTKIFNSVEIEVLNDWENRLIPKESKYNLPEQKKIEFLKIVLTETPTINKPKYYEQIADRSLIAGLYDQAVNNFTYLYDAAQSREEKDRILPNYLDACLRVPNEELVKKLVQEYLTTKGFSTDSVVIQTIENYFKDASVTTDKQAVLKSLSGIKLAPPKPGWNSKIQQWTDLLNKHETEKPPVPIETL